jgi:hypothetical protein
MPVFWPYPNNPAVLIWETDQLDLTGILRIRLIGGGTPAKTGCEFDCCVININIDFLSVFATLYSE